MNQGTQQRLKEIGLDGIQFRRASFGPPCRMIYFIFSFQLLRGWLISPRRSTAFCLSSFRNVALTALSLRDSR
jgi:hypothetical protein